MSVMKSYFLVEAELCGDEFNFEKDGKTYSGISYYLQLCDDKSFKYGYKGKLKMHESEYAKLIALIDKNESEKVPVLGADKFGNIVIKRIVKKDSIDYTIQGIG